MLANVGKHVRNAAWLVVLANIRGNPANVMLANKKFITLANVGRALAKIFSKRKTLEVYNMPPFINAVSNEIT